jgi:hypothetical protein
MEQKFQRARSPYPHDLKPEDISPVLDDLEIMRQGGKIYFAVDPYEIVDFCLPINPENFSPQDIDEIADDQAALYEIFYVSKKKPVLLSDYTTEFDKIKDHFRYKVSSYYDQAETLETFIREGNLDDSLDGGGPNLADIEEKFNIYLAVAMGLFKLGEERFRDVNNRHLAKGLPETSDQNFRNLFAKLNDEFDRADKGLCNDIYARLRHRPPASLNEKPENDLSDASAIHRLIYLNHALEQAHLSGELKQRHVLLYLSNAPKTKTIFTYKEVSQSLPKINGKPFSFWRKRNQIFAYIVYKSKHEDSQQAITESIENLKQAKRLLQDIKDAKPPDWENNKCSACILDNLKPLDCQGEKICQTLSGILKDVEAYRRTHIPNLGLCATVIDAASEYQRLLSSDLSGPGSVYIELFREACDSGIKEVALESMQRKLRWAKEGVDNLSIGTNIMQMQDRRSMRTTLRTPRDRITGIDQILPIKPRLQSKKYRTILKAVINYYKSPVSDASYEALTNAYEDYLKLSPKLEEQDPEHSLVKCYLLLAFTAKNRDEEKAYNYLKVLLNSARDGSWLKRETRYVLCWAARRLGKFEEANECGKAALAIGEWRYDARFYHGLALNIYSWLSWRNQESPCPYQIVDAISYARAAVDNYQRELREEKLDNEDVIAANYNNLAYFLTLNVSDMNTHTEGERLTLEQGRQRLTRARIYLTKLKELIVKDRWAPDHPEYFHTEAFLEYQECLMDLFGKKDKAYMLAKLAHAEREINKALELYPKGWKYQTLKEQIEKAKDDIGSGRLLL